jgi:hypothetical protein
MFLFLAASGAQAQATFSVPDNSTIELDGRYYVLLAGNLVANGALGYNLLAPTSMTLCTRSNGMDQVQTLRPLRFNGNTETVFLTTVPDRDGADGVQMSFPFDRAILRLRSGTGDLVCNGEVPAPPGLDTLFRSGFE